MLGCHAGVEMHKNLKKFFAIALTASLLITSSVPMQLSAANGDISEYGVEKFEVDNYTVCRYQKAETNGIMMMSTNRSAFNTEQTKELLAELNFPQETIDNFSEEELYHLSQCDEIYTATTYVIESDGVVSYSSVPLLDLVDPSPGPIDAEMTVDSYQRITLTLYDDPNTDEQGAYLLTGSAEWLQIPAFRMIDAFGITAQHIAVEMIDGYPAAEGYYIYKMLNTTTTSYRHDFDATEFEDPSGYTYTGVATKFNLPNDVGTTDCIYFYVYLEVRVLIDHPELTTNLDIKASYCHARAQLSLPSPSIEICGEDIVGAVGLTMTPVKDTRATSIRFNYSPD